MNAFLLAAFTAALVLPATGRSMAQEPARPPAISPEQLKAAIDKLGDLDYATRSTAARTVRRAAPAVAVPALMQAVSGHADGYVRFRALVLLTGFNDPRARDSMTEALTDANDRLRQVAYRYFEHHPDPAMIPALLGALEKEEAEFVRPALIRALAALGQDVKVQQALVREVNRGQDFFRSAVIEALGDYKAGYAQAALTAIAKTDGPLRDDAILALGRIGDKRALGTLVDLQRSAPQEAQPRVAAAICLLGVNCSSHMGYLERTLRFAEKNPGFQPLVRNAAAGLEAIGENGNADAVNILFDVGAASQDPIRAPVALGVASMALRNTPLALSVLEKRSDQDAAIALAGEGFDMLEEDFEKERFFMTVRRTYWQSPEGSDTRKLTERLIQKLDF